MEGAFPELELVAWSLINGRGGLLRKSAVEGLVRVVEAGVALDFN